MNANTETNAAQGKGKTKSRTEKAEESLYHLAREAYESHHGDLAECVAHLSRTLQKSKQTYQALVDALVEKALWDTMRSVRSRLRESLEPRTEDSGVDGLRAVARRTQASLLEYPLSAGISLGDATAAELAMEAELREKQARTNARNARWFRLIEELVGPSKRVRDVLDEATLQGLYAQAEVQ